RAIPYQEGAAFGHADRGGVFARDGAGLSGRTEGHSMDDLPPSQPVDKEFEREKWQKEVQLREREIAVKESEARIKNLEAAIKDREQELKARELQLKVIEL